MFYNCWRPPRASAASALLATNHPWVWCCRTRHSASSTTCSQMHARRAALVAMGGRSVCESAQGVRSLEPVSQSDGEQSDDGASFSSASSSSDEDDEYTPPRGARCAALSGEHTPERTVSRVPHRASDKSQAVPLAEGSVSWLPAARAAAASSAREKRTAHPHLSARRNADRFNEAEQNSGSNCCWCGTTHGCWWISP